jgi:hypothetical protein
MRVNGWQRIGIVALVALVAATSFAEATCGVRGGRRPNGKCVGWDTEVALAIAKDTGKVLGTNVWTKIRLRGI